MYSVKGIGFETQKQIKSKLEITQQIKNIMKTIEQINQDKGNYNATNANRIDIGLQQNKSVNEKPQKAYSFPFTKLIGMLFFVPTSAMGGNPVGLLMGVFIGILFYRSWMLSIGNSLPLAQHNTLLNFYCRTYFGYTWRALTLIFGITFTAGFLLGDSAIAGAIAAVLFVQFVLATVFTILMPSKIYKNRNQL